MSVLRIHKKQQNFVILDKTCLNDESLSWGAKGLHAYLMSLPDDWQVRVFDLQKRSKNGRDAVRALLVELEGKGYIKKSLCRNESTGRFGGMEYLVLENPEPKNEENTPRTENPSSEIPATKNPATENPSPENPTLINNKYNNKTNNKGLNKTAANSINAKEEGIQTQPKAAAVLFSQSLHYEVNQLASPIEELQPVNFLPQEDVLIGEKLTLAQKQRVIAMIKSLNVSQKEILSDEIEFCLLSPQSFTACGKEFGRKLNAIRKVILRGDWKTPAGMLANRTDAKKQGNPAVTQLENELREMHAEASHFKKLLATAKEHTRTHFESIIGRAQNKIHHIEEQLKQALYQQKEASCG